MNLSSWIMAARPRTLTLSVTPVLVGSSLAWSIGGKVDMFVILAALLGSIFIHLGTNLHNDVVDSERGGDRLDRSEHPPCTKLGDPHLQRSRSFDG